MMDIKWIVKSFYLGSEAKPVENHWSKRAEDDHWWKFMSLITVGYNI